RLAALLLVACAAPLTAQSFDVVSVKLHPPEQGIAALNTNVSQRPDGGLTMTNVPVGLIISRAYGIAPVNMVGLPGWANSERYDLNATASVPGATTEQRAAMLKAMLADRFKLSVHVEPREQATYDLVLARKDGTLGPGIQAIETDCAKVSAERAASALASPQAGPPPFRDFKTPPYCAFRSLDARTRERSGDGGHGGLLEGEGTMTMLANALRLSTVRQVVDKTGLAGSYRVRMNYDQMSARRAPDAQVPDDAGPSVFVALPEQLGLKLESSKAMTDHLIIDRLERPTEN
ncbi:MAG TPA: TIGR03435 family protein, partial [Vicinamibacterales bacterium]|nr:TIGR03435 family protein [Vicinamibacterales bacterium]